MQDVLYPDDRVSRIYISLVDPISPTSTVTRALLPLPLSSSSRGGPSLSQVLPLLSALPPQKSSFVLPRASQHGLLPAAKATKDVQYTLVPAKGHPLTKTWDFTGAGDTVGAEMAAERMRERSKGEDEVMRDAEVLRSIGESGTKGELVKVAEILKLEVEARKEKYDNDTVASPSSETAAERSSSPATMSYIRSLYSDENAIYNPLPDPPLFPNTKRHKNRYHQSSLSSSTPHAHHAPHIHRAHHRHLKILKSEKKP